MFRKLLIAGSDLQTQLLVLNFVHALLKATPKLLNYQMLREIHGEVFGKEADRFLDLIHNNDFMEKVVDQVFPELHDAAQVLSERAHQALSESGTNND